MGREIMQIKYENNEIIGFYSSYGHQHDETEDQEKYVDPQSEDFQNYLYGKNGVYKALKELQYVEYG